MFKHIVKTASMIAIVLSVTNLSLAARTQSGDDEASRVDSLFKEYDRRDSPGAAIVIVQNGRIFLQREYGSANLEYGIPITSRTVFHVGSVAKQFTAFSILLLEHQGRLSLDDDVRRYLPEVPDFRKPISLRHLLHHQSGLREQETLFQMSGISTADVIETSHILKLVSRQKELNFQPGEDISYCNTGYVLLAQVVEKVTGVSFRKWTRENIFDPLAMKDSQFNDDASRIVRERAYPYYTADGGELHKGILSYSYVGPTSLLTTSEDMAKWLLNFGQPRAGDPAIMHKMLFESGRLKNGEDPGYGYGLGVLSYRGLRVVWHSGHDAGYRAFTAYFPDQKFGVAVLSNFYSLNPSDMGKKIADIYLSGSMSPESPEPAAPPKEGEISESARSFSLDTKQLAEFTGDYRSEELETTYHVLLVGDHLVIRHWRNDDVVLMPMDPDLFSGDRDWAQKVQFLRSAAAGITGFRLTAGRVRSLLFERMNRQAKRA
jgi:CubicO group peptidase (beta-lactamase class C family)